MAADTYKPPNDCDASTVIELRTVADPRYVPIAFLLADLRAAAKRLRLGLSKDERDDIATDALLILCRWTTQGAKAPLYISPRGELPLRRSWYDVERRTVIHSKRGAAGTRPAPSDQARRAMSAAILQASRDRNTDAEQRLSAAAAQLELQSTDDGRSAAPLAAQALVDYWRSAERAPSLPDTDQAELWSDALGVSTTAARSLTARAYRMSVDDCAEQWQVSKSSAENILSAGGKELTKRYPEPSELLDALRSIAPTVRELLATRAYQALRDLSLGYADGPKAIVNAERAVNEWRAAVGAVPMERRAIELAAQRAGWLPENISASDYLTRLLRAEQRRARRSAERAGSGGAALRRPNPDQVGAGLSVTQWHQLTPSAALSSSSYGRRKLYARCSADEQRARQDRSDSQL